MQYLMQQISTWLKMFLLPLLIKAIYLEINFVCPWRCLIVKKVKKSDAHHSKFFWTMLMAAIYFNAIASSLESIKNFEQQIYFCEKIRCTLLKISLDYTYGSNILYCYCIKSWEHQKFWTTNLCLLLVTCFCWLRVDELILKY